MNHNGLIVTGTDTDIGKTVLSAMLTLGLDATYWKPLQTGAEDGTDTASVRAMTGLDDSRTLRERYVLNRPLSPHRAAELDSVQIVEEELRKLPVCDRPLIIEGAGGPMVPVTRALLQIDLFAQWRLPLVLAARTTLGTLNHTLLALEALQRRDIPVIGVAFIGDENEDNERTIPDLSGIKRLGRLPRLEKISPQTLKKAFKDNFNPKDFPITRHD